MWWTGTALAVFGGAVLAVGGWLYKQHLRRLRDAEMARWRGAFFRRREWLEAAFHKTASSRGTPRGLTWQDCDFEDQVVFARDRRSGEPAALVGMTIQFAAIPGGAMEEVEAVANRKMATALFRYQNGEWVTEGRAIFNLNPVEAIDFYRSELEMIEFESLGILPQRPTTSSGGAR